MTSQQKEQILYLRESGATYSRIADLLQISENTIKSFFRRNIIETTKHTTVAVSDMAISSCLHCGKSHIQFPKRKQRKFCSEACRRAWWREHGDAHTCRKAYYTLTCASCRRALQAMAIRPGSIAHMLVTYKTDLEGRMTKEQFEREKNYQVAMAIARNMQRKGLITAAEYRRIKAAFLGKYRPILGELCG